MMYHTHANKWSTFCHNAFISMTFKTCILIYFDITVVMHLLNNKYCFMLQFVKYTIYGRAITKLFKKFKCVSLLQNMK